MTVREGSLEAPTRHPLDWRNPDFYDCAFEIVIGSQQRRIYSSALTQAEERDGYSAVQLAFGDTKPQRLSKPELGHLKKAEAGALRHLAELRVDDLSGFEVGQVIGADVFGAGERVDVTGISKGKGFSGAMQRHNFKGQGASHGNHKKHRSPGSVGACATPARVFKGMKMAGQYGNGRITTQNLEVVEGDAERGILLVKGAVPGPNGGLVFVKNAAKRPVAQTAGGAE